MYDMSNMTKQWNKEREREREREHISNMRYVLFLYVHLFFIDFDGMSCGPKINCKRKCKAFKKILELRT